MWHGLHAASDDCPPLQGIVDYERLAQRADEQRRQHGGSSARSGEGGLCAEQLLNNSRDVMPEPEASERDIVLIDELNDSRKAFAQGQAGVAALLASPYEIIARARAGGGHESRGNGRARSFLSLFWTKGKNFWTRIKFFMSYR